MGKTIGGEAVCARGLPRSDAAKRHGESRVRRASHREQLRPLDRGSHAAACCFALRRQRVAVGRTLSTLTLTLYPLCVSASVF